MAGLASPAIRDNYYYRATEPGLEVRPPVGWPKASHLPQPVLAVQVFFQQLLY